jgi:hypothetical protein
MLKKLGGTFFVAYAATAFLIIVSGVFIGITWPVWALVMALL